MILCLQTSTPSIQISQDTFKAIISTNTADSGLRFRRKILYLQSLKVNPTKALHKNPNLRSVPLSTLQSITQCLTSMGLEPAAVGRVLDMHPELLTSDPYTSLYPIFDFLLNIVEIPFHEIRKSIIRCPRLLVSDPDTQLRPTFEFLTQLGFLGRNRLTSRTTLLLVSSVEFTLIPKIEYLLGIGLRYDDVKNMVVRSPGLLTFSVENNYRPKVEYFLNDMRGDLEELKRFPQYFSYSLDRKIKPRHLLLMEHGFSMSLWDMLKFSDGEFNAQLIEKRLKRAKDILFRHTFYPALDSFPVSKKSALMIIAPQGQLLISLCNSNGKEVHIIIPSFLDGSVEAHCIFTGNEDAEATSIARGVAALTQ